MDAKDFYGGPISLNNWERKEYKINFNNVHTVEDVIEMLKCVNFNFYFSPNEDSYIRNIVERNPHLFVEVLSK